MTNLGLFGQRLMLPAGTLATEKLFMNARVFKICLLVSGLVSLSKLDASEVRYTLDFSQASTHHVLVTAEFEATGSEFVEIYMPVWTPGSYLVREYARH
ncbi:MAG: hypothetical protein VX438_01395, partial [Planctomycetota bacterium]|nr:hypothetical protein [Planctomycetota bacterium]